MESDLAPVLLFVYMRPLHTKKTLEALKNNRLADQSNLFIYADGPKKNSTEKELQLIEEVRQVIRQAQWCKYVQIIESDTNKGLANSIIDGVTAKVEEYGKVIVLEDDIIASHGFLEYMNIALEKFSLQENVMHVSAHQFPLSIPVNNASSFMSHINSWGWGTWKRAWEKFDPLSKGYKQLKRDESLARKFDLNGTFPFSKMLLDQMERKTINSWAIRWYWTVFKNEGLSLFPDKSLVKNTGYGLDATHTKGANPYIIPNFTIDYEIKVFPEQIQVDNQMMLQLENMYRNASTGDKGIVRRVLMKVKYKLNALLSNILSN